MSDEADKAGFSADERRVLASVLDEIIPASEDGRFPGAGQVGVAAYVEQALAGTPDLRAMIAQGLAEVDELARGRGAAGFPDLPSEARVELLSQQGFVLPLSLHAFAGYYHNPRVVAALGLEPRPPHPKGYEMEPNDLTLVEPVRRRPRLYREC